MSIIIPPKGITLGGITGIFAFVLALNQLTDGVVTVSDVA